MVNPPGSHEGRKIIDALALKMDGAQGEAIRAIDLSRYLMNPPGSMMGVCVSYPGAMKYRNR
jgi:hypothetical protein